MKSFVISYRRSNASVEDWHRDISKFIAALDHDPELSGKISYRCMRIADGDEYLHLATAADDQAIKALQTRDFFTRYTERTRQVADGKVDAVRVEVVAETKRRV